jgi:hypothetical protein
MDGELGLSLRCKKKQRCKILETLLKSSTVRMTESRNVR